MRPFVFAVLLAGCSSYDPLIGTYNVTVSGTDTQTAPNNQTYAVTGTGTLAITGTKTAHAYVITFGQSTYQCSLQGTQSMKTPFEIEVAGGQQCHIEASNNNLTATTTGGTVTLDPATMSTGSLTINYAYSGSAATLLGTINYAGTGTRTFSGTRL